MSGKERLPIHEAFALEVSEYILQPALELAVLKVPGVEGLARWALGQAAGGARFVHAMVPAKKTGERTGREEGVSPPSMADNVRNKDWRMDARLTCLENFLWQSDEPLSVPELPAEAKAALETIAGPSMAGAASPAQASEKHKEAWRTLRGAMNGMEGCEALELVRAVCADYGGLVRSLGQSRKVCRTFGLLAACWVLPGCRWEPPYFPLDSGLGQKALIAMEKLLGQAGSMDPDEKGRRMSVLEKRMEELPGECGLPARAEACLNLLNYAVEMLPCADTGGVSAPMQGPLTKKDRKAAINAKKRVLEKAGGKAEELVGESDAMLKVWPQIEKAANSDLPVLLLGETGTGKEVVAKLTHFASARSKKSLQEANCASLDSAVVNSELFGYEKDSHSTAHEKRKGYFTLAHEGTLFLDEIGELPKKTQAKLLRAFEDKKVRPVGAEQDEPADVRIIAATNSDLKKMVADGTFREDLYHRLNAIPICLPPLRKRGDDALLLAKHFAEQQGYKIPDEEIKRFLRPLEDSGFVGNVRKLKNEVEKWVLDLPDKWRVGRARKEKPERAEIEEVLRKTKGNVTAAADELGITRGKCNYWIDKYKIDTEKIKEECKE